MSAIEEDLKAMGIRPKRSEEMKRLTLSMLVALVVIGFAALLAFFQPNPATAIDTMESAGFQEVRVTESGSLTFRCSSGDSYFYRVEATNPLGHRVEATVCCGVLKNCTIRY